MCSFSKILQQYVTLLFLDSLLKRMSINNQSYKNPCTKITRKKFAKLTIVLKLSNIIYFYCDLVSIRLNSLHSISLN